MVSVNIIFEREEWKWLIHMKVENRVAQSSILKYQLHLDRHQKVYFPSIAKELFDILVQSSDILTKIIFNEGENIIFVRINETALTKFQSLYLTDFLLANPLVHLKID